MTNKAAPDKPTFSDFGKSFQEKLVQIIVRDAAFADQIGEVLHPGYFEIKALQVLVAKVYQFKTKFKTHPGLDTIGSIVGTDLGKETLVLREQVKEFCDSFLFGGSVIVPDEIFIKDRALDFCKKQKLKEAMLKSIDLLQKSSFDEISTVINHALKLGLDTNFGHDYVRDVERRFETIARNPISTGWPIMDGLCQGGLGKGELGVVIAPTGCGKSFVLVHLGAEALKMGKTVIHYTLELSDVSVGSRYDSALTGLPLNNLPFFKETIVDQVNDLPGKLVIKEYPTKSTSIKGIRNHLEKMAQRSIVPDMIIVDYGDLLRPLTVGKERRFDLESVFEDLRALAQEHQVPVWTASQTNRGALQEEIITMASISEAYSKCFVSDFIFSLSRTLDDKAANTGKIFIAKNRFGVDGLVFPIFADLSVGKLKILPPPVEDESLVREDEAAAIRNSAREAYRSVRRKKKEASES